MAKRLFAIIAACAMMSGTSPELFAQGPPRGQDGGERMRRRPGGEGGEGGQRGQRGGGRRGGFGGQGGPPGGEGGRGGGRGGEGGRGGRGGDPAALMRMLPVLKALDKDGDGQLSTKEIANATAALKTLDKNKDGKLEATEMMPDRDMMRGGRGGFGGPPGGGGEGGRGGRGGEGGRPQRPGGEGGAGEAGMDVSRTLDRVMGLDKNKDGKIAKAEVPERAMGMFGRLDTNKDGSVTREEAEKALKAQGAGMRGGQGGQQRGGDQGRRRMDPEQLFSRFDKDKDGKLTESELPEQMKRMMGRADTNNDKAIDKEELKKAFEGRSRGGQGGGRSNRGGSGGEAGGDRPKRPPAA